MTKNYSHTKLNLNAKNCKGQLNMVILVVAILAFVMVIIFLVSLAPKDEGNREYLSMLASNLLLTLLRSDTDIRDAECGTAADLLVCASTTPEYKCEGGVTCREAAETSVKYVLKNYPYLEKYELLVFTDSKGFISPAEEVSIGQAKLREAGRERFAASETIQKIVKGGDPATVEISLFLAEHT